MLSIVYSLDINNFINYKNELNLEIHPLKRLNLSKFVFIDRISLWISGSTGKKIAGL